MGILQFESYQPPSEVEANAFKFPGRYPEDSLEVAARCRFPDECEAVAQIRLPNSKFV